MFVGGGVVVVVYKLKEIKKKYTNEAMIKKFNIRYCRSNSKYREIILGRIRISV